MIIFILVSITYINIKFFILFFKVYTLTIFLLYLMITNMLEQKLDKWSL